MTEVKKHVTPAYSDLADLAAKSIEVVKRNWKMFALVNILTVASALFSLADNDESKSKFAFNYNGMVFDKSFTETELGASLGVIALIALVVLVASIFLAAMSTSLMVRTSKGEQPDVDVLTEDAKKLWLRQFGLYIVMGLIILGGLILLIIPGIIAIIRLSLAPYFMFDKNLGIMDSIKASNDLTKQHMGLIIGAIFVAILAGIASSVVSEIPYIGALIGLVLTIALSMVLTLRYRELTRGNLHSPVSPR